MSPKKLFWILPALALAACSNGSMDKETAKSNAPAPAETAASDSTTSYTRNIPLNAPQRKVIHTADFHCKVQNVFAATTHLEQLVRSVGGIVQESTIDNSGSTVNTAYYKPDSLHQTQTYTTTALLTLRVPSLYVDSVINAIPGMVSFIDSRKLKQNDVTWLYLANELKSQVGDTKGASEQALKLAKKSKEPIEVEEYEDEKKEQKIDRKIGNLQMMDEVSFATITVAFSQPEQVYMQTIVNPEHFTQTPFALQCTVALNNGWDVVRAVAAALINLWPLELLVIAVWVVYRRMTPRRVPWFKNKPIHCLFHKQHPNGCCSWRLQRAINAPFGHRV